jgi:uncharacterized protein YjbI with pentapeptide repeats
LRHAHLEGATLDGANFGRFQEDNPRYRNGSDLSGAILTGATLRNAAKFDQAASGFQPSWGRRFYRPLPMWPGLRICGWLLNFATYSPDDRAQAEVWAGAMTRSLATDQIVALQNWPYIPCFQRS